MMPADAQQDFLRIPGDHGHRLTVQKRAVLQALYEHDRSHMTVEEIYECAKNLLPSISIATVYRAVSFLEQAKVLRKLHTDEKRNCWELIHPDEPEGHPHCICTKCGKTFGIIDDSVIHMLAVCEQAIETQYHFRIDLQNVLYYGLCRTCLSQSES